jgi:hypothetical protein
MTSTGGRQRDVQPSGGARRRLPRTLALVSLLAVAAAGGTWAEVHFAGRINFGHRISADGVSQDNVGLGNAITAPGLGGVGQAQVDDILPTSVNYPATVTSPGGFKGDRYAVDAKTADCAMVLAAQAPATVTTGCSGYLTADYVRHGDHALYSSVTVLYYPDPVTATRVAKLLKSPQAAVADLLFRQPGDGLPPTASGGAPPAPGGLPLGKAATGTSSGGATPSGTASSTPTAPPLTRDPDSAATMVRVAAVGRTVTVVQSAFADGRVATSELDTPTWYLSYTVATALAWEPDQPPASTPPSP